jgi:hypothetical protein
MMTKFEHLKINTMIVSILFLAVLSALLFVWSEKRSQNDIDQHTVRMRVPRAQFVDDKELNSVPLSPVIRQVKAALARSLGEDVSRIRIRAIAAQTILVSIMTTTGWNDILIDTASGKRTFVSTGGIYSIMLGDTILYVDRTIIQYYRLGQESFFILPGSQLSGTETYMSTVGNIVDLPSLTDTEGMITISVYDIKQEVRDPVTKEYVGQQKTRDVTFPLPYDSVKEE